jgi:hypothetical protein
MKKAGAPMNLFSRIGSLFKPRSTTMNDDMRSPNWCWAHHMLWPACEGMH